MADIGYETARGGAVVLDGQNIFLYRGSGLGSAHDRRRGAWHGHGMRTERIARMVSALVIAPRAPGS